MKNSKVGDLLVASTMVEGTVLERGVCLLVHDDQDRAIGVMLNRPLQAATLASLSNQQHSADGSSINSTDPPSSEIRTRPANHRLPSMPEHSSPPNADGIDHQQDPSELAANTVGSESSTSDNDISVAGSKNDLSPGQMLSGSSLYFGGPLSGPVVAIHGTAELAEAEAGDGIFMAAQRDHIETLMQTDQPHPYRLIVGHLGWTQAQLNQEIAEGYWHRMPATSDILWTDDGFLWPTLIRRATSQSVSRWLGVEHVADANHLN